MIEPTPSAANWRKSSYSGQGGQDCVEVADLAPVIAVRDSKNPGRAPLAFSRSAWAAFSTRLKSGL
ncbi:DUF397 domain-containing protein [Actinocorallia populi]|uniref:DUF397 domain-containing protein n=1 Tax=Actinocorallia populi TaxID=2079200 RepID=UPI000D089E5C|nr:DUF397 domain-containing protein [Actinocorallia populi]